MDVLIAPNSHVNIDVPVIGNHSRIISSENATENYIVNTV